MHIIITGGSGLIGRALTTSLLHDQHRVTVLSRHPSKVADRLPAQTNIVGWDARTAKGWGHQVEAADAIVNLAGESIAAWPWTAAKRRRIRQSRVDIGQAVVEAFTAAKKRPRVLVQASGVGYYGPRGEDIVHEDATSGKDFLARVAVDWEAATAPVEALGVRRVVIRTGAVLSREGGALPRLSLPFRLFVGGPLGNGRQRVPWIHIADEIAAIRFLLTHEEAEGPFNLTAPHPPTNAVFSKVLGRVMRRPAWVRVPAFAVRLVLGEMSTIVLRGQRAEPERLLSLGYRFKYPALETALKSLLKPESP